MATSSASPRRPPPPPPPPPPSQSSPSSNQDIPVQNGGSNASLTAAADLIRTLDSAFEEMSSLSVSAAKDAEDARKNARAASEMARRYTARSFPSKTVILPPAARPETRNDHSSPNRKRKNQRPPSSGADRLAQSHAEDVLAVSLELERTKQDLEHERQEHDQTRMGYTEHRAKNAQLESQMDKLLADMERQREAHGRSVDSMERDLDRAKVHVEAAEEDAQAALDLATESAESKQQLESWLERALEEVTLLREQLENVGVPAGSVMPTTPTRNNNKKNSVRFAATPTVVMVPNRDGTMIVATPPPPPPPPPPSPSRSMVVAGRNLLAASRSPESKMHAVTLTPQKSAERRQRLRDRLKSLDEDVLVPTPQKTPRSGVDMGLSQKAMDTCHSVANILRVSARKLKFPGRWGVSNVHDDVESVENLARRYCNAVEVRLQVGKLPLFQIMFVSHIARCYSPTFSAKARKSKISARSAPTSKTSLR
jgi:hypothetical protein